MSQAHSQFSLPPPFSQLEKLPGNGVSQILGSFPLQSHVTDSDKKLAGCIAFTWVNSFQSSANMGSKLNLEGMLLFEQPFARVSNQFKFIHIRC